jgi:hypothetical protein
MAKISIKTSKPYVEKVIQASLNGKELRDNITIGVKVYNGDELDDIREEYLENLSTAKVLRWQKQLQELPEKVSLSEEDFDTEVKFLEESIKTWNKNYTKHVLDFCKKHVCYVKNASLSLEIDDKATDLLIADSRDVKPIESLWETSDECLVVLLDIYLGHPSYKDSLINVIPKLLFNTDFKDGELKN